MGELSLFQDDDDDDDDDDEDDDDDDREDNAVTPGRWMGSSACFRNPAEKHSQLALTGSPPTHLLKQPFANTNTNTNTIAIIYKIQIQIQIHDSQLALTGSPPTHLLKLHQASLCKFHTHT